MGWKKYGKELSPINNRIDAILQKQGLECIEEFDPIEKPVEIDRLLKECDDLWDRKIFKTL